MQGISENITERPNERERDCRAVKDVKCALIIERKNGFSYYDVCV